MLVLAYYTDIPQNSTEVGQLMTSFRPAGDKAWNYVREWIMWGLAGIYNPFVLLFRSLIGVFYLVVS